MDDAKIVPLISNIPVENNDNIAVVTTYQGSVSLGNHAQGFIEIAIIAVQHAFKNEAAIDSIVPSIIYAIRHATELFLKYVIADLSERHKWTKVAPKIHQLKNVFDDFKGDITLAFEVEALHSAFDYRTWLKEFENVIGEVDKFDPDGTMLRYPTNQKGKPNLGGSMSVSLRQVELFARHADNCFLKFRMRYT